MHLKALTDGAQERDGQSAPKMFAEFLQSIQHHKFAIVILVQ